MEQIINWAKGNPGALMFLMLLISIENIKISFPIIQKLEEAESIRGTNLFYLWSDLCGKDFEKVAQLCKNCPTDILEDVCNRQDYSGKNLVEQYFS